MIYCDTSLIVSMLTVETATDRVRKWLLEPRDSLAISDWTLTEVASALAMKVRRGVLTVATRAAIEQEWLVFQVDAVERLPVLTRHFQQAAYLVDAAPRGLRSGDALHLAVALDFGCTLATLDVALADAATARGVPVHPA